MSLRAGMVVFNKDRAVCAVERCQVGDYVRCASTRSDETWTRIERMKVEDADTFIRLHFSNDESLDVTPHHLFQLADGSPMRAERLCLTDFLVGRFGRLGLRRLELVVEDGQKITLICEPGKTFFAGRSAATVLTHG